MEAGFVELLALLNKAHVDYLLVGGLAVALSGFRRYTEDVDLLLPRDPQNHQRLIQALGGFGEGFGGTLTVDDFEDSPGALCIMENFGIDLFIQMGGLYYEDLLEYRQYYESDGLTLPYLNAQGLMLLKKDSHREKDQHDMIILRELQSKKHNPSE